MKIGEIHLNAPILSHFKGCGYNSKVTFNGAVTVCYTGDLVQHFDTSLVVIAWSILGQCMVNSWSILRQFLLLGQMQQ